MSSKNRRQVWLLWINYMLNVNSFVGRGQISDTHTVLVKGKSQAMCFSTGFSEHSPSCVYSGHTDQQARTTVAHSDRGELVHLLCDWDVEGGAFFFFFSYFLFLIFRQHLSPAVLTFTVFFESLCFFSHTCSKVYQRKHLPSQGWPPRCDRLIQVEWTSFRQRTLIIMKALRTQCGLTSDRPFPASSALS